MMIKLDEVIISDIICHKICNEESGSVISDSLMQFEENDDENVICNILLKPFLNVGVVYEFYHNIDIELNVINKIANDIVGGSDLVSKSKDVFNHLFSSSRYPNIKNGDLIVARFEDLIINNKYCDALCICKIENKDSFIETGFQKNKYGLRVGTGVSSNKIDKACLIIFDDKNPSVIVVDKNRNEAQFWFDDFLSVRQRQDEYYNTQNAMNLAKSFIKELPKEFEVSKADQVDLANRTVKFFKEKDSFDMGEFANEVIGQPEVIDSFNNYKQNYAQQRDIEIAESFAISDSAAKKGARSLKSVIKLDKNFHIYIHGDRNKIENGEDEKGKFYKVYYEQEQ